MDQQAQINPMGIDQLVQLKRAAAGNDWAAQQAFNIGNLNQSSSAMYCSASSIAQ